ncbi:MAG TPA: hypothetical protein VF157_15135, partial [Chloroflexota bacterium]
ISLPSVDLTQVIPSLVLPFLSKLAQVIADALGGVWDAITGSGINLLSRTAPEWVTSNADALALANDLTVALNGITALAVVVAGIGIIGREFWGFSWGPVESAAKIALGVVYGSAAIRLCAWSVDLVDQVNSGLGGTSLAKPPGVLVTGSVLDTLVSALLLIPWFVIGLWLMLLMAERLGMLVVLFVIAPVAIGVWGIPQVRWVSVGWAKMWFGWLVAQPLALICLKLASVMAGLFGGGSIAVFVGIAMLLVARQAALMFVPGRISDWGGTVMRAGIAVALRR